MNYYSVYTYHPLPWIEKMPAHWKLVRGKNLYKKMQTMLGVTPNDFIRNVRLKHAAELLIKSQVPVNQLSLMVGFQTPRYFSQCFRKMFGVTPTEYREGKSTAP